VKAGIVASLNNEAKAIKKEISTLSSKRTKIEQYDLKNSGLLQRSGVGSIPFTEQRWTEITEKIQDLSSRGSLVKRARLYFSWIHRNFVMMAFVDCALAKLISVGKISSADIFVYARAVEDVVNLILLRSRSESELISMSTSIDTLKDLRNIWGVDNKNLLTCTIGSLNTCQENIADKTCNEKGTGALVIKDLTYSRGSARVHINKLSLEPGVYAVTGANGSGKSTLFHILMGCDTNEKSVDLPKSISIQSYGSISMPGSEIVEISQNIYWPLYTKPIDWIYNSDLSIESVNSNEQEIKIKKVEEELQSMNFYGDVQEQTKTGKTSETNLLRSDIMEEKDDWFSDLSGGQKSKAELVRKVFLSAECPRLLLIDETLAPLDPESKSLVMQKLKAFCKRSILLIIYHADVKFAEGGIESKCVPSSNFFDNNLHLENASFDLRPPCADS